MQPTCGVQIDVLQFLAGPDPATLSSFGKGAHAYLALPEGTTLVATNRDPTMYEYGARPNTEAGVYATIHAGGVVASVEKYMSAVAALQPDLYVTLCDEITLPDAKPKRNTTSVTRTLKWLEGCLAAHSAQGVPPHTGALAAVAGAGSAEERARAAKGAAEKAAQVAGFALCGFGTGESEQEREAALGSALSHLPHDKPRFLSGVAGPEAVLAAVAQGVDVLDDAYVAQVTAGGYALTFPLQPPAPSGSSSEQGQGQGQGGDPQAGADDTKINLWSPVYRLDKGPLLPGCACYACARHSRAYLHHLLQTNEMLATVLLEVHNTHHYQAFMSAVREAIAGGRLAQYRAWFSGLRAAPVQPGQGPGVGVGKRWQEAEREAGGEAGGDGTAHKDKKVAL